MRENTDQKNFEYGHFLRSGNKQENISTVIDKSFIKSVSLTNI